MVVRYFASKTGYDNPQRKRVSAALTEPILHP